jgi:hypothetical protein
LRNARDSGRARLEIALRNAARAARVNFFVRDTEDDRPSFPLVCRSIVRTVDDDMHHRLNAAEDLIGQGKHDEATAALLWLWDNMAELAPEMAGVRVSFMAHTIAELVRRHPPARRRFAEIRDRAALLAEDDGRIGVRWRSDWIVLNEILADDDRTLTWFDSVKDDDEKALLIDRLGQRLLPLLKSRGRLCDIGRLFQDPVARLIEEHACFQPPDGFDPDRSANLPDNLLELMWQSLDNAFRSDAALLLAGLLAAGRSHDAEAVDREARRLDPSDAMAAGLEKARGRLH